jgi:acetyl esterase/lipase
MNSRILVDPELIPLIEQLPGFNLNSASLEEGRAAVLQMLAVEGERSRNGVDVREYHVPGPRGAPDVRVLVSAPTDKGVGRPAILHIHGGGYVLGAADMTLDVDSAFVSDLGAVVASVDYRLAPETSHPGLVEDCYAALAWLIGHADELGVDRGRIAINGASAGGGLAACLALMARDRGEYQIAFQHLVSPMLDDRTAATGAPSPFLGEFVWTPADNLFGWTALLGHAPGGSNVSPYAAAARASDLAGLPPTFLSCGSLDLFVDEDMDYARRLVLAGVPTETHIYPGAPHAFGFIEAAAVSRAHARDSLAAFKRALRVP